MTIFSKLKAAHGAGYRAGRAEPIKIAVMWKDVHCHRLVFPKNPFTRGQFIRAALWDSGYYEGRMERLNAPGRNLAHGN